jgi:hypothetical protein
MIIGADLIISAISKLVYGYHLFDAGSINCQVHGIIITLLLRYEIIIVMVLALYRYFLVIHNIEVRNWIWVSALTFFAIFFVICISYGALTQETKPNPSYSLCNIFTSPGITTFTFNLVLTLFNMLPCWITTYCYFSVGWKVNKRLNELKVEAKETEDSEALKIIKNQRISLVIQISLVFIIYNVNFSLSYVTYFLRLTIGYKRTPFIDALACLLYNISIMATPIVTISFQPEINTELKLIFVILQAKLKNLYNNIFF